MKIAGPRAVQDDRLPSDSCGWVELLLVPRVAWADHSALRLGEGWSRRWTAAWRFDAAKEPVVCAVRDLASMPVGQARPVRRFSWRTGQRHRPGLFYMVSTGRHHGYESLFEAQLLLALDFAGRVADVVSQPFRLQFVGTDGAGEHIPDFLAVTAAGTWLIDVRPAELAGEREDRIRFTAAAEAAQSAGWGYALVTGWRPNVQVTLDAISAQRRPLTDPLGIQDALLSAVESGPVTLGDLAACSDFPPVARAHALHLLWHRRLAIDLARPLGDRTLIRLADAETIVGAS